MTRFRSVLAGICVVLIALAIEVPVTFAQTPSWDVVDRMSHEQALATYQDCGLRKLDRNAFVEHYPVQALKGAPKKQTATIEVDYNGGFPPEAEEAFQRAVNIWETHVSSPVTIEVDANWEDNLPENTLGTAGPFLDLIDTSGDGSGDTIIGFPLFDALTGVDQSPGNPDIVARFNSRRTDWHFGEGPAPEDEIDFTSVVLHEIGHGLNYIDLFNQNRPYGFDFNGDGEINGEERSPGPYGRQLVEQQSIGTR